MVAFRSFFGSLIPGFAVTVCPHWNYRTRRTSLSITCSDYLFSCISLVTFRGQNMPVPHPYWQLLGVVFESFDEHVTCISKTWNE